MKSATWKPGAPQMASAMLFSVFWSRPLQRLDHLADAVHHVGTSGQRRGLVAGESLLQVPHRLPLFLVLGLQPLERRGQFLRRDRHVADAAGHRIAEGPQDRQRAAAAHELDANAAAEAFGRQHGDQPRRCRYATRGCRRTPTCRSPRRRSRGACRRGPAPCAAAAPRPRSSDTNRMPTGRSSQTMRLASASAAATASAGRSDGEVERGDDGAEVEADRAGLAEPVERRGEDVLAGVLLHVIEPPRPVDRPVHAAPDRDLAVEHVPHLTVVRLDDVDDERVAERPGVARLTAGERVERRRVQRRPRPDRSGSRLQSRPRRSRSAARRCSRCDGTSGPPRAAARGWRLGAWRPSRTRPSFNAGSATPASANPFARSLQLSQWPHGAPAGVGIVAAVRQAVVHAAVRALAG